MVLQIQNLKPSDGIAINTGPPSQAEVKTAIKTMKNGKDPGIDSLRLNYWKQTSSRLPTCLSIPMQRYGEHDFILKDWRKGLIFKLPKKGDLSNCGNWRGITLLSVPSKVFCRVLLKKIDSALYSKIRQEQAGFRKGQGCIDQIFCSLEHNWALHWVECLLVY